MSTERVPEIRVLGLGSVARGFKKDEVNKDFSSFFCQIFDKVKLVEGAAELDAIFWPRK